HGILQCCGFPGLAAGPMEGSYTGGKIVDEPVDDFTRMVLRSIINGDHQQFFCRIVNLHQCGKNAGYDLFFVVGSDKNCDHGPISCVGVNVRMALKAEEPVQCETIVP